MTSSPATVKPINILFSRPACLCSHSVSSFKVDRNTRAVAAALVTHSAAITRRPIFLKFRMTQSNSLSFETSPMLQLTEVPTECSAELDSDEEDDDSENVDYVEPKVSSNLQCFNLKKSTRVYIGGYLMRQVLEGVKRCKTCRRHLVGKAGSTKNVELLLSRQYTKTLRLQVPTNDFVDVFNRCYTVIKRELPKICAHRKVRSTLTRLLLRYVQEWNNVCPQHELANIFLNIFTKFYVRVWCQNVNNILSGKDVRDVNDSIKEAAEKRFHTYSKRGRAIAKTKNLRNY